jgi:hypothetical protein
MTDYTITTDFGAKDSLPSGNAAKVIKGSEFTTEFTNIKTAVNSKADTAGDTFTGAVTFDAAVTLNADVTFDTNTMFVDVSENRVGIGTTSPYVKTEIVGGDFAIGGGAGSGQLGLEVRGTPLQAIPSAQVRGYVATGDSGIGVAGDLLIAPRTSAAASVRFITGTSPAERLRIDSSGNVGIGTSSPNTSLHVKNGDFRVEHTRPRIYLTDTNNNSDYSIINNNGDFSIYDDTNAAYRMYIDSSGNVLVGKTSTSSAFTTVGIDLRPEGRSFMTRSGGPALYLSRTTSDGNIAEFYKDGSIVGSISVRNSDNLAIAGDSSHSGLSFGTNELLPFKNTTYIDNTLNIGSTTFRFKDLYLSGGVHLGGTGNANKLDDYEEGTWTPTLIGSTSGSASLTVSQATYTKIGNTVRVACYITGANVTGLSGAVRLGGLPFSVFTYSPATVTYCNLFSFDEADGIGGFTEAGQSYVNLVFGSSKSLIQHTSADATSGTVMFTAVYNTSA